MNSTKYIITDKGRDHICSGLSSTENLLNVLRMLDDGNDCGEYNFRRFMMNKKQILKQFNGSSNCQDIDELIEHMLKYGLIREVTYLDYYNDFMLVCDSMQDKELATNIKRYCNLAYNLVSKEDIDLLYCYVMDKVTSLIPRESRFYASFDADINELWGKFKNQIIDEKSKIIVIDTIIHNLHANFNYSTDRASNNAELLSRLMADAFGLIHDDGTPTYDSNILCMSHNSDVNILENLYDQGLLSERTQKRLGFVKK